MIKQVSKIQNGLKGEIEIPADKSISHRAIMLSSLAKGKSIIRNFSQGADCKSTLELFKLLGVEINYLDDKTLEVLSNGELTSNSNNIYAYPCGNSGTTMRLVSGILAGQKFNSILTGDESLSRRPMRRIIEPLTLMGAKIEAINGHAPLTITGKPLQGITYQSQLSSAQVKSCILLAGLNADGKTIYIEPSKSRDHTEKMLQYLGVEINIDGNMVEIMKSELEAKDIDIVGDISSAAFFIVAALITPKSDIIIKNVGINPTRSGIIDVAKRMNGQIKILDEKEKSGEKVADIRIKYSENLIGTIIEGDDIPRLIDELPVIAVLASQADGTTLVRNAEDLRNKEADRISCIVSELKKIGIDITETRDGFVINGKTKINGDAELECYHDHRLAMSFYVAGLICEKEIAINGFEWTKISFPEFESLMNNLT
ncbi:MAG: 3-phosphoshikimate 1-carboxyvinyltransferase [bacterium]|nr:3-phosphoshikimate 1-carboxyvinyltransferase [bacterium]